MAKKHQDADASGGLYVYVISRAQVLYLIYMTEPEGREARGRGHVN